VAKLVEPRLQARSGRLLERRVELGLGQVDLAQAAGISQGTVSRLERGGVTSRRNAAAIAVALKTDIAGLFRPASQSNAERAQHRRLAGRWGLERGDDGVPVMLEARPALRERRLAAGLSMKATEKAAGVCQGTLSPLEGRRGFVVSRDRAVKISAVIGVDVDDLFTPERTQPSCRGGRRRPAIPPKERAQPDYMRDELAQITADANARGLVTIDQARETFRRAAALAAEKYRRRWRPDLPYVLPTYTRQAVNYYVKRGDLEVATWVPLSTGKRMRLFRAADVDELALTRFAFPNGNALEWDNPSDAVMERVVSGQSGPFRQRVKGRRAGKERTPKGVRSGGKPRGYTPEKAAEVKELRRTTKAGYETIAFLAGLSVKQVRTILAA